MQIEAGWIHHEVAAEFPQLGLRYVVLATGLTPSPPELRDQLADMTTRYRGRESLELPHQPIPAAYRSFLRQVGLDPDVVRHPAEAVNYDRMVRGRFLSLDRLHDALTTAIVETHVALTAFDADEVTEPLGIRPAQTTDAIEPGTLAIADADHAVAPLLSAPLAEYAVSGRTRRTAVVATSVAGVPDFTVEHSLWRVADLLGARLGGAH